MTECLLLRKHGRRISRQGRPPASRCCKGKSDIRVSIFEGPEDISKLSGLAARPDPSRQEERDGLIHRMLTVRRELTEEHLEKLLPLPGFTFSA